MERIQTVRKLFITSDEHVSQITNLLYQALDELKKQHHGTIIGKKLPIDYQALFRNSQFPQQMQEEIV